MASAVKIEFEIGSRESEDQKHSIKDFYFEQDAFVPGKRLIDPVTGKCEGDDDKLSAFEELERSAAPSKRQRMDD